MEAVDLSCGSCPETQSQIVEPHDVGPDGQAFFTTPDSRSRSGERTVSPEMDMFITPDSKPRNQNRTKEQNRDDLEPHNEENESDTIHGLVIDSQMPESQGWDREILASETHLSIIQSTQQTSQSQVPQPDFPVSPVSAPPTTQRPRVIQLRQEIEFGLDSPSMVIGSNLAGPETAYQEGPLQKNIDKNAAANLLESIKKVLDLEEEDRFKTLAKTSEHGEEDKLEKLAQNDDDLMLDLKSESDSVGRKVKVTEHVEGDEKMAEPPRIKEKNRKEIATENVETDNVVESHEKNYQSDGNKGDSSKGNMQKSSEELFDDSDKSGKESECDKMESAKSGKESSEETSQGKNTALQAEMGTKEKSAEVVLSSELDNKDGVGSVDKEKVCETDVKETEKEVNKETEKEVDTDELAAIHEQGLIHPREAEIVQIVKVCPSQQNKTDEQEAAEVESQRKEGNEERLPSDAAEQPAGQVESEKGYKDIPVHFQIEDFDVQSVHSGDNDDQQSVYSIQSSTFSVENTSVVEEYSRLMSKAPPVTKGQIPISGRPRKPSYSRRLGDPVRDARTIIADDLSKDVKTIKGDVMALFSEKSRKNSMSKSRRRKRLYHVDSMLLSVAEEGDDDSVRTDSVLGENDDLVGENETFQSGAEQNDIEVVKVKKSLSLTKSLTAEEPRQKTENIKDKIKATQADIEIIELPKEEIMIDITGDMDDGIEIVKTIPRSPVERKQSISQSSVVENRQSMPKSAVENRHGSISSLTEKNSLGSPPRQRTSSGSNKGTSPLRVSSVTEKNSFVSPQRQRSISGSNKGTSPVHVSSLTDKNSLISPQRQRADSVSNKGNSPCTGPWKVCVKRSSSVTSAVEEWIRSPDRVASVKRSDSVLSNVGISPTPSERLVPIVKVKRSDSSISNKDTSPEKSVRTNKRKTSSPETYEYDPDFELPQVRKRNDDEKEADDVVSEPTSAVRPKRIRKRVIKYIEESDDNINTTPRKKKSSSTDGSSSDAPPSSRKRKAPKMSKSDGNVQKIPKNKKAANNSVIPKTSPTIHEEVPNSSLFTPVSSLPCAQPVRSRPQGSRTPRSQPKQTSQLDVMMGATPGETFQVSICLFL